MFDLNNLSDLIQEIKDEESSESTGDKHEDVWYSTGRLLLEKVRSKADQRLSSSTVSCIFNKLPRLNSELT